MKYSSLVPRRFHYFLIGAIFYWFYANKFLTYSVDYVTQMSRDLSFGGVQQNIAYYSNESLILSVGGFLLISYLLIQNEFSNLFNEPRKFENPPNILVFDLFTIKTPKIVTDLNELGVETVSGEYQPAKINDKRTLAILAPTNKAASVIRQQGVAATTIHRILYSPIYDPEYEKIADWLNGKQDKPIIDGLTDDALKRAESFFKTNKSIPGALAVAGLRGSDFITGWKRREEPLDIGFVDESSMLDEKQLSDLRDIFSTLILFGDPAQLAPVGNLGKMVFDDIDDTRKIELHRIHRQEFDNPILDLAHTLADPDITFNDFESEIVQASSRDERVIVSERVISDMMAIISLITRSLTITLSSLLDA